MRGMTPSATSIVTSETPRRTLAIFMDFVSAPVRYNAGPQSMWIGGDEFLGVGALGEFSAISEEDDIAPPRVTVALSGIPRDSIATSLTELYQNRPATIWEVPLDGSFQPVDPFVVFRGLMDQMTVEFGETARVVVTLQNSLARWERPNNSRYTPEEQEKRFPGDTGLRFIAAMAEKEVVWPAKSWFPKNP